ncbi:MAG TPA: response regulator [Polyangiaceae bacterium]|jgi:CheY-like chemotaxis protein|nr:response regulator [Polyangiaceae bacterium]
MRASLTGRSILITDDDPDGVELLAAVLRLEGAEVRTARCAAEALEQLDGTWQPDALLLDLGMPDVDGHALLRTIRERPALRAVPAVAVTAYAFKRDAERSAETGFARHVTKPYEIDDLVKTVADLIATRAR